MNIHFTHHAKIKGLNVRIQGISHEEFGMTKTKNHRPCVQCTKSSLFINNGRARFSEQHI